MVKTCYVNKPWAFCSRECYKQFVAKWTRNQDAGRGGGTLRKVVFYASPRYILPSSLFSRRDLAGPP